MNKREQAKLRQELTRLGIDASDAELFRGSTKLRCSECHQDWYPNGFPKGSIWRCPNGCRGNHTMEQYELNRALGVGGVRAREKCPVV